MSNIHGNELEWTGRLFGGIRDDIRRKAPHYASDFKDGLHSKVAGTTLFLYFAALANAIAFGALTGLLTGNQIGIIEMLAVTAVGGIIFALFSGQPLTILGGTGPIVIFTGLLYTICNQYNIPFLATYAWVGIWSGIILLICAFTDASALMKYFSRFTDEIFAALISVIFIVEAVSDTVNSFGPEGFGLSSAFLTVILALGTFMLARSLKDFTGSRFLSTGVRNFLSDFGPALAIIGMTAFALLFPDVKLSTPKVPDSIETTSGRPWLVDIFAIPTWVIFASIGPAILATILLFLDQNITTRLVNSPDYKLKKGGGYHLDLAIVGLIVLVGSLFALPWIVAATVHSLNHVKSLAETKTVDAGGISKDVIVKVRENRLSGLIIHLMIAGSIFLLDYFGYIPMAVLFGLFLYMGFASLGGNQFFDRLMLWITDPKYYPQTPYTERVPKKWIHRFTIIQLVCFVALWALKSSQFGILFPLMIAGLVLIQLALPRFIPEEHVDVLSAEDFDEEDDIHLFD
ncbi:sodium bicarbonate transporter family protein [Telluribacter humicola]|uniref:sodium bicarbonate transporter family protein n=1 Tax=Telluribacter humicola TaxID=1720261 RepID=UPI001A96E2D2|nr:sodium bicarbonate transporter family protein [Telluribacter humicola]